jgi:hypothetical protein
VETLSWFAVPRAVGRSKFDREREAASVSEQLLLVRHLTPAAVVEEVHQRRQQQQATPAPRKQEEAASRAAPSAAPAQAFPTSDANSSKTRVDGNDGDAPAPQRFEPIHVEALAAATSASAASGDGGPALFTADSAEALRYGHEQVQDFVDSDGGASPQQQQQQQHTLFAVDLIPSSPTSAAGCNMTDLAIETLTGGTTKHGSGWHQNVHRCVVVDRNSAASQASLRQQLTPAPVEDGGTQLSVFVVTLTADHQSLAEQQCKSSVMAFAAGSRLVADVTEVPCISEEEQGNAEDLRVLAAPSKFVLELISRDQQ